jgi:hypothetical protein
MNVDARAQLHPALLHTVPGWSRVRSTGTSLWTASDDYERQWLLLQVDDDPAHLAWLCAEVSERALTAVVGGRATPMDAIRHSATGTVELFTVEGGHAVTDRGLLCAQVDEYLQSCRQSPVAVAA